MPGPIAVPWFAQAFLSCRQQGRSQVTLRYPLLPRASRSHVLDQRPISEFCDGPGGVAVDGHGAGAAAGSGQRHLGWGATATAAPGSDRQGRALPLYLDGCARTTANAYLFHPVCHGRKRRLVVRPHFPTTAAAFLSALRGPDRTLFAYAVFLLNKDIEQVLNAYGAGRVGPSLGRCTLAGGRGKFCAQGRSSRGTRRIVWFSVVCAFARRLGGCQPQAYTPQPPSHLRSRVCGARLMAQSDWVFTGTRLSTRCLATTQS